MPKRILDEDAWVDGLKKIIEKNYFPDIKRRNLQFSFLGAYFHYLDGHTEVDANSLYNSAHALAVYYNMLLGETPDLPISSPSEPSFLYSSKLDQFSSLSAYLTSTTSEDNASFEKLLEAINAKKREKFAVTYGSTTNTALNMIEQAPISSFPLNAIDASSSNGELGTLPLSIAQKNPSSQSVITQTKLPHQEMMGESSPFKKPSGKNALFFRPSSSLRSLSSVNLKFSPSFKKENTRLGFRKLDHSFGEKINIENVDIETLSSILLSRIKYEFSASKQSTLSAFLDDQKQPIVAKEGSDIVNSSAFVPETPLLVAGENAPSIFTWGTIDGTPIPLAPPTPNRSFRILPVKEREAIGRKLAHDRTATLSPFVGSSGGSKRANLTGGSSRSSHRSARAILSASPAIRRMIGASIRRLADDKADQSDTPLLTSNQTTPKPTSLKTEWEALTPDISKSKFNSKI